MSVVTVTVTMMLTPPQSMFMQVPISCVSERRMQMNKKKIKKREDDETRLIAGCQ